MPNSAITRGLSCAPHPSHTAHFSLDNVQLNKHWGNGTIPLSKALADTLAEIPGFGDNEKFPFLQTSPQTLLDNRAAGAARRP